jgi:2-hydroxychromene-2-carboxylate isomerase
MAEKKRIEFWFDFCSTYSYLTAERIEALAAADGIAVIWRPFLLGPLFLALGWNDSPFNIYPAKGRYMWRDMERLAQKHGLPFKRPSRFPRDGLLPARIACAYAEAPWCPAFVRAAFSANFAENRDIGERAVIADILTRLSQPADAVIAAAETQESKDRLRQQTGHAEEIGLFGAPSLIADGELFWGNDRLEDALAWLRREKPTLG